MCEGGAFEAQLDFWWKLLRDSPPELRLPCDYSRPAAPTTTGKSVGVTLATELGDGLRALARSAGVSLFVLLLAAFKVLLAR